MIHHTIDIYVKFERNAYGHEGWPPDGPSLDLIDRMLEWCRGYLDENRWGYFTYYSQVPGEFTCTFNFREKEDLLAFKLVFDI